MVGSTHGGKSHFCPSGADWYAKWGGDPSVRGRVRVAHHKTLPFEHDGLRVVLAEAESQAASQEECQSQHGTGSRAARGHHGRIADPVRTTRQPLGGLLVLDHLVQTYSLLSSPLALSLFLYLWCSLTLSNTLWHTDSLRLWLPSLLCVLVDFWEGIQTTVIVNPDESGGKKRGRVFMSDSSRKRILDSLFIKLVYSLFFVRKMTFARKMKDNRSVNTET